MDYDVAIIGLGPAGATLARCLKHEYRVIAIDKKEAGGEAGFHKPCGGLLAPDAQKSLSRFNLTLPVGILVDPQIFSVRTIDLKTRITRHYQRHYINLDRHRFDQWLSSLIPKQVDLRSGARCVSIARGHGGFAVTYTEAGLTKTVMAKWVVGADGANSLVRRTFFPWKKMRTYLSIQQWFPDTHKAPFYSCVFDPDATDCYAWGLTKGDYFIFGGAFAPKDARGRFEGLKERLAPFGFVLKNPVKTEACLTLRPGGPLDFCCGGDGVFLIGEAAGFISPSSLEGISYAIDSGFLLSRCLNNAQNPNRAYTRGTLKIRLKLLLKNIKSPFMYHPFLRKLVMKSGLNSFSMLPGPEDSP